MTMKERIAFVREMVNHGGPGEREYEVLEDWFLSVMADHWRGSLTTDDIHMLWDAFGDAFTPKTMQGFVVRKPHGYHGDWEIMDRIYTCWTSPDPHLRNWDLFFHSRHAPRAVRNRIRYFHSRLDELESIIENERIDVLVVGCGPARDIRTYLEENPGTRVVFTCIDQDPAAIDYAQGLCAARPARVNFRVGNAIRHLPKSQFDLVWASGLFDYFSDRLFTFMIRQLYERTKPGRTLLVGNFSPHNPTRAYMEFGGWVLFHRTEQDMKALAEQAGIPCDACHTEAEAELVDIFLQVRKGREANKSIQPTSRKLRRG